MNSSLAFDVHSQHPLTASVKRRQNVFSNLPLGAEGKQHLPLPWFSCLPRCHLCQGCFLVLAPSSSSSAAHHVLAGTSPKPSRACLISTAQGHQCKSAPAALHLRSAGRAGGPGRHKETKQKGEEERQRVMKRSVAHGCQRKSLAVFL